MQVIICAAWHGQQRRKDVARRDSMERHWIGPARGARLDWTLEHGEALEAEGPSVLARPVLSFCGAITDAQVYDKTQPLRPGCGETTFHRQCTGDTARQLNSPENALQKGAPERGGVASSTETGPHRIGEGRGYSSIARH